MVRYVQGRGTCVEVQASRCGGVFLDGAERKREEIGGAGVQVQAYVAGVPSDNCTQESSLSQSPPNSRNICVPGYVNDTTQSLS